MIGLLSGVDLDQPAHPAWNDVEYFMTVINVFSYLKKEKNMISGMATSSRHSLPTQPKSREESMFLQ
jgi:hypothetical protein